MTTVEILFRYSTPPSDSVSQALAAARDVYGIRQLVVDAAARTVRVEFDATRLTAAGVARLMRGAGLDVQEELALIAPPAAEPAPAT